MNVNHSFLNLTCHKTYLIQKANFRVFFFVQFDCCCRGVFLSILLAVSARRCGLLLSKPNQTKRFAHATYNTYHTYIQTDDTACYMRRKYFSSHVHVVPCSHVHGGEDEDTDEQEVRQLEHAVEAPPDEVERRDPHRDRAHGGHPPHRNVETVVVLLRGSVGGLADGVAPTVRPDPVDHEEEGVDEERDEGHVAGEGVVEHGALVWDAQGGPDLAVAGDRDEDDGEVGGAHEPKVDRGSLEPAHGTGGGGGGGGRMCVYFVGERETKERKRAQKHKQ